MKKDLLIFTLSSKERFAVDVAITQEIITLGPLNRLPGANDIVMGITRVRDLPIAVIDTQAVLFGTPAADKPKMAIVLDLSQPIALAVSEVSHVHKFDSDTDDHSEGKGGYVEAIIHDEKGLIQLLRSSSFADKVAQRRSPEQVAA